MKRSKVQGRRCRRSAWLAAIILPILSVSGPAVAQKAVFDGGNGLWVTDGTAVGTKPLAVKGASAGGILFPLGEGPDFTPFGHNILFAGVNTLRRQGLWLTDGTASGTREVKVRGACADGVLSFGWSGIPFFTPFGQKVLFEGCDANIDRFDLWITNATIAGTTKLTARGASSEGLFYLGLPAFFRILGSNVLFEAQGARGGLGLWVTNGKPGGTKQLNIPGAYSGGLFTLPRDPGFTRLGNRLLFQGSDQTSDIALWTTDGTEAGTRKLKVSNTAYYGPVCGALRAITLDKKVLYRGVNPQFHCGLWVTDGTSRGTKRLVVKREYGGGLFGMGGSVIEPHFTLLGDKVLFVGEDTFGDIGLWATDGTAAGTEELRARGAHAGGLFYDRSVQNEFVAFRSKVLFVGMDAAGKHNMWVTDGTSVNTKELRVKGAGPNGLLYWISGGVAPGFTIVGNKVLFAGLDDKSQEGLWATDGTAEGTKELNNTVLPVDITAFNPVGH